MLKNLQQFRTAASIASSIIGMVLVVLVVVVVVVAIVVVEIILVFVAVKALVKMVLTVVAVVGLETLHEQVVVVLVVMVVVFGTNVVAEFTVAFGVVGIDVVKAVIMMETGDDAIVTVVVAVISGLYLRRQWSPQILTVAAVRDTQPGDEKVVTNS